MCLLLSSLPKWNILFGFQLVLLMFGTMWRFVDCTIGQGGLQGFWKLKKGQKLVMFGTMWRFVDCVFEVFLHPKPCSALGLGALHTVYTVHNWMIHCELFVNLLWSYNCEFIIVNLFWTYNPKTVHGQKLLQPTVQLTTAHLNTVLSNTDCFMFIFSESTKNIWIDRFFLHWKVSLLICKVKNIKCTVQCIIYSSVECGTLCAMYCII